MKPRLPALRSQTVLTGGALLAPVLLVQVVRMLFASPGPATAAADMHCPMPVPAAAVDPIAAATPRLNPPQSKAVEWLKEARMETASVSSPFPAPVAVKPTMVTVTEDQPAIPTETALPREITSLTLTSVLRAPSGRYATLSGTVATIGEEIVPGWKVTEIDLEKRAVTLVGPGGRTVLVSQDAPVSSPKQPPPANP